MTHVVAALEWLVLLYFVLLHAGGIALELLAIPVLRRRIGLRPLANLPRAYSRFELPVSIVVPACDEEATVVASVRDLLQLDYPEFEVIVVNDGSRDATLEALQQAFALDVFPEAHWRRLPAKPVRAIYRSRLHANLRVVDKEAGGKADALNVGINASRYPLFCTLDGGAILQRDGLRRAIEPFLDDPSTVASTGTMRIENGRTVADGNVERVALPASPLALVQVVETLHAVVLERLGWARLNAVLEMPGARVYRKDAVVEAGGYRADTAEGDTELVMRLHRVLGERGEKYAIHVVPETIGWMRVPESAQALKSQRMRAQQLVCQSLHRNAGMMRRVNGAAGLLAYPFYRVFECYGALFELAAYAFMAAMWLAGQVSGTALAAFLAAAFSLGLLRSVAALLIEDVFFHLYPRGSQVAVLVAAAIAENLGYRQLVAVWRLMAFVQWLRPPRRAS